MTIPQCPVWPRLVREIRTLPPSLCCSVGWSHRTPGSRPYALSRKGFHRVPSEQSRAATIRNLRGLRDEAVRVATNALNQGDWRAALESLWRAQKYDRQAAEMEQAGDP